MKVMLLLAFLPVRTLWISSIHPFPTSPWFRDTWQNPPGRPLLNITAQFDTAKYPNLRFTVKAYPCDPTPFSTVSGTITQHGNLMRVAGLEICLMPLNHCTSTDTNGSFTFIDVPDDTYTLTSDGPAYKPLITTVEVSGMDVFLNLVQFRGGGR